MHVDRSGLLVGVLTGRSCPLEPWLPRLMPLSAADRRTPLYLSRVVMAGFGNVTLASVSEIPSHRFMCVQKQSVCFSGFFVNIVQLFISVRAFFFFSHVQQFLRPAYSTSSGHLGSWSQEESQATLPTGAIRSEINLSSVETFMCQWPLELTGFMEQRNERGR